MPSEKRLVYSPKEISIVSERIVRDTHNCVVRELEFWPHVTVYEQQKPCKVTYYQLKGEQKRPLILCLPIMDGKNKVARLFAGHFAAKGYHAAIVHKQKDMYSTITPENYDSVLNVGLEQIVYNHMQALDWFEQQPEVDAERIGVAGVSMGSIKALLVSAYDQRIKATFAALTGGDLPYIMSYSDDGGVTRKRNRILESTGKSVEELREALDARLKHDPLKLAPYIDANEVMLVLASHDKTVPFEKGDELRQAIGNPRTVFLLGTHLSSLLYVFYILEKADFFFKDRLDVPNRATRKSIR